MKMNMNMYWSQHEVFLLGILSLFPDEIKDVPLTPSGKWQYYFGAKDIEQLAQQLEKYKQAGYLDFDVKIIKFMHLNLGYRSGFSEEPEFFTIKVVNAEKAKNDLKQYIENYSYDKLLTDTTHKPDDSVHQHEKLITALARTYNRQDMPRISRTDVYGDAADDKLPFWETVLAPHLVGNKYEIRQMGYDINAAQPFIDIKITDMDLDRTLALAAKSSEPISDEDPKETPPYKGLQARRDGLIYYNDKEISFSPQQREVMRVFFT